jgi:hypothetical protein
VTLGLLTLGTFNERQSDQLLVRGGCSRETQNRSWKADKSITGDENCITKIGAWGRMFGQHTREHFAQGARPDFDGTFAPQVLSRPRNGPPKARVGPTPLSISPTLDKA